MDSKFSACRRRLWFHAAVGLMLLFFVTPAVNAVQPVVKLVPLADVRLLDGPFKHAQDVNRKYLMEYDVDRLIAPFRTEAGLPPKAERYVDWERTMGGHAAGHYLSAMAQLVASTGDAECKKRLDYMVAELAECQRTIGDGYVGGVSRSIAAWDQIAAGNLRVTDDFHFNGLWVPWFNLHKTFAGLRDAWLVAGNAQARDVLVGLCDWCEGLTGGLFDEQMQQMLVVEPGGMNEVLADVAEITGNKKYLALARRFSHRALLDPLLAKKDALDGLHVNMQVPKVTGFARIGELADEPTWIDASRFFWDRVALHRSVAIGGAGVESHFHPADDFSMMINMRAGPETCATHNLLRLTEQLYRLDGDPKYVDYYERCLFNDILSSQNPETGGLAYHTGVRPRDFRTYSRVAQDFWCCVGTGTQNHSKHGRFIYALGADDSLYVNLFIASELSWSAHGLKLRQETEFPDAPRSRLVLSLKEPARMKINVRYPVWIPRGELKLSINGQPWPVDAQPSSYVAIERQWRDGDRVDIDLPMHTQLERLPDGSPFVAVLQGPIVLAAKVDDPDFDALYAAQGPETFRVAPLLPIEQGPKLIGSEKDVIADIKPVAGRPLTFMARKAIRPAEYRDLELIPFFRVHDSRYMIYWPIAQAEE